MKKNHPIVAGTIILTLTGFASRIIGFFYRIFLSQTFGEEGMGIYQLISPAMALAFSFSAAGIQTAISKYVASESSTHDYKSSFQILLVGTGISTLLSAFFATILYQYSLPIATSILLEERCAPLLRIIALSIPFGSIHACINGYFYGIKSTKIPAITQLVEQVVRVGSVYIIYQYIIEHNMTPTISFAVVGIIIGEIASMLVSVVAIYHRFYSVKLRIITQSLKEYQDYAAKIMLLALPLMANRIVINLLQSVEAIFIPNRLMAFGLSNGEALSVYGVLTGMALTLVLFPSTITNSISVLLLPVVSEADSNHNNAMVSKTVTKCIRYCLLLGFTCTAIFLFFGKSAGVFLFHSELAGTFITILSFICPFLYLTSTLSSVLHGLGKATYTFISSLISLSIRLVFVFFFIPYFGIKGYLYGLLCSQLVMAILLVLPLRRYFKPNKKLKK